MVRWRSLVVVIVLLGSQYVMSQHKYSLDELTGKADVPLYGKNIQLRKQAYDAFVKMRAAASKDGIAIQIVSSYRGYARQKAIWERKYANFRKQGFSPEETVYKIMEYSTIPGTSRHHWGTDIDIIDANQPYKGDPLESDKFHGDGPFCALKEWMDLHANTFGFYLVYTDNDKRTGFYYEPWHYTYLPLSEGMLNEVENLPLSEVFQVEGLSGKEVFNEDFMRKYMDTVILGINSKLLKRDEF